MPLIGGPRLCVKENEKREPLSLHRCSAHLKRAESDRSSRKGAFGFYATVFKKGDGYCQLNFFEQKPAWLTVSNFPPVQLSYLIY